MRGLTAEDVKSSLLIGKQSRAIGDFAPEHLNEIFKPENPTCKGLAEAVVSPAASIVFFVRLHRG